MIRLVFIASAILVAKQSIALDLQYDQRGAMEEQLYNEAVLRTRNCMRGIGQAQLSTGTRDQEQIVFNMARLCGLDIRNVVANFMHRPDLIPSTDAFIVALAYRELGRIPGVTITVPPSVVSAPKLDFSTKNAISKRDDSSESERLSESTKATLSQLVVDLTPAIADQSAPVFAFQTPENAQRWVHEMSNRLRWRIPDRKARIELLKTIQWEATRAGLDPQLVLALIDVASNFSKYAVSSAGARGYMQVMPFWITAIGVP